MNIKKKKMFFLYYIIYLLKGLKIFSSFNKNQFLNIKINKNKKKLFIIINCLKIKK